MAQVQDISLDGKWRFVADSADLSNGLPANAQTVTVPHTYNVMPELEDYAGRAWYDILRDYTLRYTDATGHLRSIALPTMYPGQRYDITVPDINARFRFDICRPDGGACLNY